MNQDQLFAAIRRLEGNLSPSHVQAIRDRSSNSADYYRDLLAEYRASQAAIARLNN